MRVAILFLFMYNYVVDFVKKCILLFSSRADKFDIQGRTLLTVPYFTVPECMYNVYIFS